MTSDPRPPRTLPQAVLDAMPGAVAQLSPSGEILGVNASWRALASLERLLPSTNVPPGANYLEECERAAEHFPEARDLADTVRTVLAGHDAPAVLEYKLTGQAATVWVEVVTTRLDGDGFRGALVTHVDITARKAAAEAARRTETQYRAIVESAPVGIYQTSPDGRILAANQSLADIIGAPSPDDLIGTHISLLRAEDHEVAVADQQTDAAAPVEVEWKRFDDVPIWVEVAARAITDHLGRTVYYEGFVYDISERKRLEAQLVQAQKMESVGRLAGGIAHDFNNLLTVMIGYAEMLHESDAVPAPLQAAVAEILAAARRAAELTGRMLAFARKQRVQPRAIDVNDVMRGMEGLLRRIIGEHIRLDAQRAADLPAVLIDPAQLEQVVMNLTVNARDAMPDGGTLTVATDVVDIGEEQARRRPGLRAGRHVRIRVADTGVGMDADTLARLFEPFFTTKEPGKGTGLGLAMCYGIVKQAGGFIGCESAKGVGTTCSILLPEAATAAGAAPLHSSSREAARARARTSTILVVEDETVVRQFVAEVLRAAGHVVHATGSPEEGLEIANTPGQTLDLLLTDMVMPQMDGVTLAARMRETHPALRVLLMSGYQDRAIPEGDSRIVLLPKPFTAAQLRHHVDAALRRST